MHLPVSFLFLFAGIVLFSSCENDIKTVQMVTQRTDLPMITTQNAELLYSDSARVKVKLTAPVFDQYVGENPRIVMPRGVKISFFNDSLKVTTTLRADSAIRREKDNMMEARKRVVVGNKKGDTLHTEKLIWDERRRIIYTDVHVLITSKNNEITEGEGLEANEDFTRWKIKKAVVSMPSEGQSIDKEK